MRRFKYMLWLLVAVFCLMPCGVSAAETQKDLKIQEVFQRYGKKRNVTMVELSNEMLETYGMTRYKSITIKDDPEALRFTRQCLEADQKGARKIKEVGMARALQMVGLPLDGSHHRGLDDARNIAKLLPFALAAQP